MYDENTGPHPSTKGGAQRVRDSEGGSLDDSVWG
jgi:hypothetical protein